LPPERLGWPDVESIERSGTLVGHYTRLGALDGGLAGAGMYTALAVLPGPDNYFAAAC